MEEKHICDICGKLYTGYGNDAYPVYDGKCCNDCNRLVVIPARLIEYRKTTINLYEV